MRRPLLLAALALLPAAARAQGTTTGPRPPVVVAAAAVGRPSPPAAPALPALLRPQVVVEEGVVRLGDLFDNAGPRADAVVGSAPPPGRRIVVETAHLLALARAHGVDWRPLAAGERAVVERPGRAVARDEVERLLRADLQALGADAEGELELPGFVPPQVPGSAFAQLAVEGTTLDAATGRFAATLVVVADGAPPQRQRVAGRVLATAPVVVAARRLLLGEVVRAADLRLVRQRVERVRPGALQRPELVVGQQLRRPVAADAPFLAADLGAPVVVARNAAVALQLDGPGLSLSAQGRALEEGGLGARIAVLNPASGLMVEAEVTGPGRARVVPGAQPREPRQPGQPQGQPQGQSQGQAFR